MFKSVIETIFIFVTLSILSRHLTKADTQNLAQSFGAIDQDQFAVHPHPRFGRFRRADDAINFPKEEEQTPQTGSAKPDVPKVANEGEANKNETDLESRFFLGGGGLGGGLGGIVREVIGGLANQGFQQNYGPGFGGGYNQYPGYGGGYNQYPGYGGGFGGPGYGPGYGGPGYGYY